MKATSYIELSKSAFKNNIEVIRSMSGENVEIVSVVKGNAYGHGIEEICTIANLNDIYTFAVYSPIDALRILESEVVVERLIIMGNCDKEEMEWAIQNGIEFFLSDIESFFRMIEVSEKLSIRAKVHLELETGMNRTGIADDDQKELIENIKKHESLFLCKGICSHLGGAESISNHLRIKKQIIAFRRWIKRFDQNNIAYEKKHLACSAGLINYSNALYDMVRVGILQYGFWPSKETKVAYFTKNKIHVDPLIRVISWKSSVKGFKSITAGDFIGYGTTALAEVNMNVAIVPVGYSDGYSRSLSNLGNVLIKGHRCNVVGMVNMNMIMIDITHIDGVCIGDEVVLIGNQKEQSVSVASFSELSEQLNYELLTRLPAGLPRKLVE